MKQDGSSIALGCKMALFKNELWRVLQGSGCTGSEPKNFAQTQPETQPEPNTLPLELEILKPEPDSTLNKKDRKLSCILIQL